MRLRINNAHRQGHAKLRAYIRHQERNGWISDFGGLDDELAKDYKAVEKRLREFENATYND